MDHLKSAGSDIRLASGALLDGVPPNAILALLAGACTGLLLLAVGCCLALTLILTLSLAPNSPKPLP